MLTADDCGRIRLHRDGMSIHELASTVHHSRTRIRQILKEAQPRPCTRSKPPPAPILGAFHAAIDAILAADADAPPKQRHTAMQVIRRLRDGKRGPAPITYLGPGFCAGAKGIAVSPRPAHRGGLPFRTRTE